VRPLILVPTIHLEREFHNKRLSHTHERNINSLQLFYPTNLAMEYGRRIAHSQD